MNASHERPFEQLEWPNLNSAMIDRVKVDYDADADHLYLFFDGAPSPAVWDPPAGGETWIGLRAVGETWTGQVVGVMVEHFKLRAIKQHPSWSRVLTAHGDLRAQAVRRLIADVAVMPPTRE
jgi:hypothetical protein